MPELSILLIGDHGRDEFRDAVDELLRVGQVQHAASVNEAIQLIAAGEILPDVIVLAQAFADEFSVEAVERLRSRAPLARVVGLLGSWCEGEMRTGHPWPATLRVYWHQWQQRASPQLAALAAGNRGAWSLPTTATEEERLLADDARPLPRGSGLVAVATPERAVADWLLDVLERQGYAGLWWTPYRRVRAKGIAAGLLDMADTGPSDMEQLTEFTRAAAPAPVIAMMHFPRIHEVEATRRAGAASVLSKPYSLDGLFQQLADLIRGNRSRLDRGPSPSIPPAP